MPRARLRGRHSALKRGGMGRAGEGGGAWHGAAVWSSGFRPFFLAAAAYGPLLLAAWYGARLGWWTLGAPNLPLLHAHELLFGHDGKLRERTSAQIEDAGEDGIARLEASHATSHLHHDTRQIAAQRGR